MNDTIMNILLSMFMLCMGFLLCYVILCLPLYGDYSEQRIENLKLQNAIEQNDSKYTFEKIALHLADEHNYSKPDYMCGQFSQELKHRLQNAWYTACYIEGDHANSNKTNHAWVLVEIPIEATSGKVIDPKKYIEKYEEMSRDCE